MSVIYAKYNRHRYNKFQIETSIKDTEYGRKVYKKALKTEGIEYLNNMIDYYNYIVKNFPSIHIAKSYMKSNNILCMDFIEGKSLKEILKSYIYNNDISKFKFYFDKYISIFKTLNVIETDISNLKEFEDIFSDAYSDLYAPALEHGNIDLTFSNIIVDKDDNFWIIDYELCFDFYVPIYYIISRAVDDFIHNSCLNYAEIDVIYNILAEYYPIYKNNYIKDRHSKCENKLIYFLGSSFTADRDNQLKKITNYMQYISDLNKNLATTIYNYRMKVNKYMLEGNGINMFGYSYNSKHFRIYFLFFKITLKIDDIAWWIPVRKWRDKFRNKMMNLNS